MNEDNFTRKDPPSDLLFSPAVDQAGPADPVRSVAVQLKDGADQAMQSAKTASSEFVRDQKEKLASTIEGYSSAVEAACERLEGGPGNRLAAPAHRATEQMNRAVSYLRSHEVSDFINDTQDLARRRPELVFGTMFVAGLASARFLKASRSAEEPRDGIELPDRRDEIEASEGFGRRARPFEKLTTTHLPSAYQTTNKPLSTDEW